MYSLLCPQSSPHSPKNCHGSSPRPPKILFTVITTSSKKLSWVITTSSKNPVHSHHHVLQKNCHGSSPSPPKKLSRVITTSSKWPQILWCTACIDLSTVCWSHQSQLGLQVIEKLPGLGLALKSDIPVHKGQRIGELRDHDDLTAWPKGDYFPKPNILCHFWNWSWPTIANPLLHFL